MRTLVWRVMLVLLMAGCIAATPGPGSVVGGPRLGTAGLVVDYAAASVTGFRPPALVAVSFTAVTFLVIGMAVVATRRRRRVPPPGGR